MSARPVSDRAWFGIRAAARRHDWDEVAQRAEELEWPIVAYHARRAAHEDDSLRAVTWALLLDQPDTPDPFKDRTHA
jgi:hypothetical protein